MFQCLKGSKFVVVSLARMRPSSIPSVVLRGSIHKNKDLPRNDMNRALHLMSGCSAKLREQAGIVEAAKNNLMGLVGVQDLVPIAKVTDETIASFNILKKDDVPSGFEKPPQGIINIDLLANPILKEKFAGVPSVSRILNDTMSPVSRAALDKWKLRMIDLMGESTFQEFYKAQLDQGKNFHESVKGQLMGSSDVVEKHKGNLCLKSVDWVLKDISDVAAVESFIVHPSLGYKGIFDCVAKYKGKPVLIEWKHSNNKKSRVSSTYDAPIQMTAYMGALSQDKNYNFQVENGLVVVAHADGSPAELFEISIEDCQKFWTLWLQRLSLYITNQRQKAPTP